MKKTFLGFLFLLLTLPTFAAYQYNSYVTSGTNGLHTSNSYFTFTDSTSLYLKDVNSTGFLNRSITEFGYYDLNTKTSVKAEGNKIGDFSADQKIALWFKDNKGNILSTKTNYSGTNQDNFCLYYQNNWLEANLSFGHIEYSLEGSSAPSGQPLPGVIAGLLVGALGIGFGASKKKQRKNS